MDYKIIAVDFDGTLCYSNWPLLGEPNIPLINYLKNQRKEGNKLILWTCRAGNELTDAVDWCHKQGLTFDAINDNLPEVVELYGNNSRKITCDYYIDDRAILPALI
jgi:hydroxymethylpyrimidine pyrophosphatase-like HAD family hydrolase